MDQQTPTPASPLAPSPITPSPCHCLAVRQAARRLTQLYDHHLAATGLRTSQYGLLRRLCRVGPISINAFAESMVMDRTTMGRALRPLTRDGLVAVGPGPDGRTRALTVTALGRARVEAAHPLWQRAQEAFETSYGAEPAGDLRRAMMRVVEGELPPVPAMAKSPSSPASA